MNPNVEVSLSKLMNAINRLYLPVEVEAYAMSLYYEIKEQAYDLCRVCDRFEKLLESVAEDYDNE